MTELERLYFEADQIAAITLSWADAFEASDDDMTSRKAMLKVFDDLNDRAFGLSEKLREMIGEERDE